MALICRDHQGRPQIRVLEVSIEADAPTLIDVQVLPRLG
eukprot:CAMPEP_0119499276 /NCGR_PEP_ID=MMETSP1344-20130328/21792_1 /TAXON_ID=236787 /ORGANISM="Florenciella parvula, Strain CCMP2471" /LENGTH=38 /DNA_ID= /DNA_START= /DNA_END= /DNA_ORIENTATION=